MERYYVVRIYRRPTGESQALAGIVEDITDGRQQAFHSLEELGALLAATAAPSKNIARGDPR